MDKRVSMSISLSFYIEACLKAYDIPEEQVNKLTECKAQIAFWKGLDGENARFMSEFIKENIITATELGRIEVVEKLIELEEFVEEMIKNPMLEKMSKEDSEMKHHRPKFRITHDYMHIFSDPRVIQLSDFVAVRFRESQKYLIIKIRPNRKFHQYNYMSVIDETVYREMMQVYTSPIILESDYISFDNSSRMQCIVEDYNLR